MATEIKLTLFICLILCIKYGIFCISISILKRYPEAIHDFTQYIKSQGYILHTYEVATDDNYIVTVHRLYQNNLKTNIHQKPVVFLMHGLTLTAGGWFAISESKILPYLLIKEGYDVWFGNCRGSKYAPKHKYLNSDTNNAYWNFSWHELGIYDAPAMIDYVLNYTKQEKLTFIGHSMGATTFAVMLSEKPIYNEKIKLFIAHAPPIFMGHTIQPTIVTLSEFRRPIEILFRIIKLYKIEPDFDLLSKLSRIVPGIKEIVANYIFFSVGYDSPQLNRSIIPTICRVGLTGVSTKELVHFAQIIATGEFRKFDYGKVKNIEHYDSSKPPTYNLDNLGVATAVFYGKNDLIVTEINAVKFGSEIPNLVLMYQVKYKKFNHADFLWASNVKTQVYDPTIKIINKYRNS